MIHNSGLYGQSEVPINMGVPLNVPQINTPTNLPKYSNSGGNSSSTHYGPQEYNNPMHHGLNMNQYQLYPLNNYNPFQNTSMHQSTNAINAPSDLYPTNPQPNFDFIQYPITKMWKKHTEVTSDDNIQINKKNLTETSLESDSNDIYYDNNLDLRTKLQEVESSYSPKSGQGLKPDGFDLQMEIGEKAKVDVDCDNFDRKSNSEENSSENSEHDKDNPLDFTLENVKKEKIFIKVEHISENEEEIEETSTNNCKDLTHINTFTRDVHGTAKDCVEELHSYVIFGPEQAMNIVKTGDFQQNKRKHVAFECPKCLLVFTHIKRYLIHMKWHTFGLTYEKRQQKKEAKELLRLERRKLNAQVKRSGEARCSDCYKTFRNKRSLNNHRQRYHSTSPKECKTCHKILPNWKALMSHIKANHTEENNSTYNCDLCPKTFKVARSLQRHLDTHLEKVHPCQQCDKKFGSVVLLNTHMKTHEKFLKGMTFHCSYCGKGFYDTYTLAAHERKHRNERPYLCHICHSDYGTNSGLQRHLKVSHNSEKPWECTICHRYFATEAIRDRHVLRSHGSPADLQFPCNVCSKRYGTAKNLQKHCNKVHPTGKRRKRKVVECDSE